MSSLVRTNKQAYAILSDVSGNAVTVSGSSLKVALSEALPSGTNNIGGITAVTTGTGATQLGTQIGGDVSSVNVGVNMIGIKDSVLDGAYDGSYESIRLDGSGAIWTHLIPGGRVEISGSVVTTNSSVNGESAAATTDAGTVNLAAIDNTFDGTLDGSYTTLRADASGALWTHLAPGTFPIGTVEVSGAVASVTTLPHTKAGLADASTTDTGAALVAAVDSTFDGVLDGSYTSLRADVSGALWTRIVPGAAVTVTGTVNTTGSSSTSVTSYSNHLYTYTKELLYDTSFTSEDDTVGCFDISTGTSFSFAGRAQKDGSDVSFVLAMYACSGATHGTPDNGSNAGDMLDTGYTIQNLGTGGPFFATFNDLAFPYVSFKNVTNAASDGGATDICLHMFVYRR